MKIEVEVEQGHALTDLTQRGVRFPDGTIIWARPGFDSITAPWKLGDRAPEIVLNNKKSSYYDQTYAWADATRKYHEYLTRIGANYDPEMDVLELVERMIIVATSRHNVVTV